MRAGQEVRFGHNRTDLRGRPTVNACAVLKDCAANDFGFKLFHELVGGHLILRAFACERVLGLAAGFVKRV